MNSEKPAFPYHGGSHKIGHLPLGSDPYMEIA